MSTPNFPRMYRLNTAGAPPNTVPGVSSGRAGDFVLDGNGALYYYNGTAWSELESTPAGTAIVIEPDANATGNGYDVSVIGGESTAPAGPADDGGDVNITGGASTNGNGGGVVITAGAGAIDAGDISLVGVAGLAGGNGSEISLVAGDGNGAGVGGDVVITAGDNITGAGDGGGVLISAGSNTAGGDGGDVVIASGSGIGGAGADAGNVTVVLGAGDAGQAEFRVRNNTQLIEYLSVSATPANVGLFSMQYAQRLNVTSSPANINAPSGRIVFGLYGALSCVVNNTSVISANSIILLTVEQYGTATNLRVTPAPGSFTITSSTNLDGATLSFVVINNAA